MKENKWTSKSEHILAAKLVSLENNLIYLHAKLQTFWCLMEWSCSGFQTMHIDSPLIQCGWYSESSFVSHLCGTQNAFSCSNNIITMIRSSGQPPFSPSPPPSPFPPSPPSKTQCCWNIVLHFQRKPIKIMGVFTLVIKQHREMRKLKRLSWICWCLRKAGLIGGGGGHQGDCCENSEGDSWAHWRALAVPSAGLWLCPISVQDGDSPSLFYYRHTMSAYEPALRPLFLSVLTNGRNC